MPDSLWVSLNGCRQELPDDGRRLIDWLREDMRLTGTKQPCGAGHCGGCSILLDGDVVPACCVLAASVDGREIFTIEGLAEQHPEDPLFEAFIYQGAAQCGYCTAGMIIAARAFLNRARLTVTETSPIDRDMIRQAIAGNICRCTGYVQIIEAVLIAAKKENLCHVEAKKVTWEIISKTDNFC